MLCLYIPWSDEDDTWMDAHVDELRQERERQEEREKSKREQHNLQRLQRLAAKGDE
jgi:hypothetical protein